MTTGKVVGLPVPIDADTPDPLKVIAVAPVKSVPVIVAPTIVPCIPLSGVIVVITGGDAMVYPLNGDVVPNAVASVTVLKPSAAAGSMSTVIGTLVEVPPLPIVPVTPDPLKDTTEAPLRLLPKIVAGTLPPRGPIFGEMLVMTGVDDTLNPLKGVDVVPPALTVTVRNPRNAPLSRIIVIGTVVEVLPVTITAVTPVPLNVTA